VITGIGLGILALVQLIIAWASDRSLEKVDKPLFADQVLKYPALGIKDWFGATTPNSDLGPTRVAEVLRLARLASAARSAVTALAVSFISLVGAVILVAIAKPQPGLRDLRLGAAGIMAIIAGAAIFVLFSRIGAQGIALRARTHVQTLPDGTQKRLLPRYWARLRSPETLSRYLTIAFVGAVVAIVASVGL
jgi:hypothetical protein